MEYNKKKKEVKKKMPKKRLPKGKIKALGGVSFDFREFGGPHGIRTAKGEKRYCPSCGTLTSAKHCPNCHTMVR